MQRNRLLKAFLNQYGHLFGEPDKFIHINLVQQTTGKLAYTQTTSRRQRLARQRALRVPLVSADVTHLANAS